MSEGISIGAFTPELLRNCRIQLRQGRVVATVVICAAVSFSAVAYFFYSPSATGAPESEALNLLRTMVGLQVAVLLIGGGIYCLQSVHREKELNTFDYQRITRLKPIELGIGKLLGAPALTYFVVACLIPITLFAAFVAQISFVTLLQIYAVILLGSITYHLLALVVSLIWPAGSSAGTILFFIAVVGFGSMAGFSQTFGLRQVSPFFALELLAPGTNANPFSPMPPLKDLFLGTAISHVLVLVILYATFSGFFLLAMARNIKRDPSVYEIYSPWQGLAFALYLVALALGFFRWVTPSFTRAGMQYRPIMAGAAEVTFLSLALWLFAIYGWTLLRNRERVRRRIRQFGTAASGWWAAIWPMPYLLVGALATGAAILAMIRYKVEDFGNWTMQAGALEAAFFALWLARDFQYLQWMNLRRGRRPLVAALLYLIIFYVCASALMVAFGLYGPIATPYRAIFMPSAAFGVEADAVTSAGGPWILALLLLGLETFGFVWLQRRELGKLANPAGK